MKTVFLIVLSAFYAENGAFLMAFHNFKSISHRFSKQFHMLFYCFADYSRQGETFSYYGFKAYRRCNHVILKMIGYKMDIRVLRADISIFSYKQSYRSTRVERSVHWSRKNRSLEWNRVDALYFLLSYNLYFIFILLTISVLSIVYVDYFPYLYKIL